MCLISRPNAVRSTRASGGKATQRGQMAIDSQCLEHGQMPSRATAEIENAAASRQDPPREAGLPGRLFRLEGIDALVLAALEKIDVPAAHGA